MTHEEMLKEIDEFRAKGHIISITGNGDEWWNGNEWVCTFDNVTAHASTPELAWMAAKSHRQDAGPK